ncbi:Bro-N domain-containing protein [Dysgonomonas sp. 521]|uniref:Bro-N domain-containing protein n=1 Tax=Dysgonomonas sp. 521 TaxID=2302932 RepID=UPI0013D81551|nr:Bro-N domain-containing protein [Dysgonomonas sp. 521]
MKEKQKQAISLTVTDGVTVNVVPDSQHNYVMTTKEVAEGYGMNVGSILKHLQRKKDELIEGKHYLRGAAYNMYDPNQPDQIFWTKRGVIRLGFTAKTERAKRFRDWAEDLILKIDEQRDLFGNAIHEKPNYRHIKKQAFELVVLQGKTQKEAASVLQIAENTMSEWARQGNWRAQRKAAEMEEQSSTLVNRFFAVVPDICEIEDKELRMRIISKLAGEGVIL